MDERKMTVFEHLEELRIRIIIAVATVVICSIGGYFVAEPVMKILASPLGDNKLVFLTPSEGFVTHIKISIVTGAIIAFPMLLYQIWAFVGPALTITEKKYTYIFLPLIVIFFIGGVAMGTFLVLPTGVGFLINFSTIELQPMLAVGNYFSFALTVIVSCGVVFELPLVALLLGKLGLIDSVMLVRYRKYSILCAFIISAVITPSVDMCTQILVAGPIILLYEVSIILLKVFGINKRKYFCLEEDS